MNTTQVWQREKGERNGAVTSLNINCRHFAGVLLSKSTYRTVDIDSDIYIRYMWPVQE